MINKLSRKTGEILVLTNADLKYAYIEHLENKHSTIMLSLEDNFIFHMRVLTSKVSYF